MEKRIRIQNSNKSLNIPNSFCIHKFDKVETMLPKKPIEKGTHK